MEVVILTVILVVVVLVVGKVLLTYLDGSVDGDWNNRLHVPRYEWLYPVYEFAFKRVEKKRARDAAKINAMRERAREYERKLMEDDRRSERWGGR